jgi:hypothetical protein
LAMLRRGRGVINEDMDGALPTVRHGADG